MSFPNSFPRLAAAAGGFLATRGPHQVALAEDLSTPGAVLVVTADGQTLRSVPVLLAYVDRATGQSVRLADLKPSRGELIAANTVLYSDAFDTLEADVRAVYTAADFECDVILRRQPMDPAFFGLSPDTTDLAVYSELFETQPTRAESWEVPIGEGEQGIDTRLEFGNMVMGRGRAFGLDLGGEEIEVTVRKSWERLEQRDFLIERTAWRDLHPLLRELPEAAAPTPHQRRRLEQIRSTAGIELPARSGAPPSWPRTAQGRLFVAAPGGEFDGSNPPASKTAMASLPGVKAPGVVLDYSVVNTTTNKEFDSLTTFYVTGPVNLSGVVTFRPGTVIKYAKTNGPALNVLSGATLNWLGAPYRPVCLTARDDDSVGEPLPGSTGTPAGTYAAVALNLDGTGKSSATTLTNLSIRHATVALQGTYYGSSGPLMVRPAQFVNCGGACYFQFGNTGVATYFVQNALIACTNSGVAFRNLYYAKVGGEFLTVDGAAALRQSIYNPDYSTVAVTNSLIAGVGNTSGVTFSTSDIFPSSGGNPPVFLSAGAGAHYLNIPANGAIGGTPVDLTYTSQPLVDELLWTTVHPPAVLTGVVSANLRLSPNFDALDATAYPGYHYWILDHLAAGVTVTNAVLTLAQGVNPIKIRRGVALAGFGNGAVSLQSRSALVSQGSADALNHLCWSSAVQELPIGGASAGATRRNLVEVAVGTSLWPEIHCRQTQVDVGADTPSRRGFFNADQTNQNVAVIELQDCQIAGALVNFSPVTSGSQALSIRNCLFQDCQVGAYRSYSGQPAVTVRNSLFRSGSFTLYYYSFMTGDPQWICTDNLFDGASLSAYSTATNRLYAGWNGYSAASAYFGGSGNKTSIATAGFQIGPLGPYYYPASGGAGTLFSLVKQREPDSPQCRPVPLHDPGGPDQGIHQPGGHWISLRGNDRNDLDPPDGSGRRHHSRLCRGCQWQWPGGSGRTELAVVGGFRWGLHQ